MSFKEDILNIGRGLVILTYRYLDGFKTGIDEYRLVSICKALLAPGF